MSSSTLTVLQLIVGLAALQPSYAALINGRPLQAYRLLNAASALSDSTDNLEISEVYMHNGVPHQGLMNSDRTNDDRFASSPYDVKETSNTEKLSTCSGTTGRRRKRFVVTNQNSLWPNGIVPYVFGPLLTDGDRVGAINAMALVSKYTCIRFVPWDNNTRSTYGLDHDGHIVFTTSGSCWSTVGLSRTADGQDTSCCTQMACVHELGHALGFQHEQQSYDRDGWIQVNWDYINPVYKPWYSRMPPNQGAVSLTYDLSSPMHYAKYAGSNSNFNLAFPELYVYMKDFYMFSEISKLYNCQGNNCSNFQISCQNDGYVTMVDGQCACRCVEGLDPATGCTTILAKEPVPAKFPGGSYAILQAIDGCPKNSTMVSSWVNQYFVSSAYQSPLYVLGTISSGQAKLYLCVNEAAEDGYVWPPGEYCIMRKGGACPAGFTEGYLQFDNVAPTPTKNTTWKTPIPDGIYYNNTRFLFCCRSDGNRDIPISLPTTTAFTLYRLKYEGCQSVKGMGVISKYIRVQNALVDNILGSSDDNSHPLLFSYTDGNFYFYYCYYFPLNRNCGGVYTLTASQTSVSFTTPNYPLNYGTKQECIWTIQGPENSTLLLTFSDFDVEGTTSACIDSVEVRHARIGYAGLSYCGFGMKGSIRSTSNKLYVRFYSDVSTTKKGFNATVKIAMDQNSCYKPDDNGASYRGKGNFTRNFQPCLPWANVTQCRHHAFRPDDYDDGLDENYCRNPGDGLRPWCYVQSKDCQRNYCDVCQLETPYDTSDYCATFRQSGLCSDVPLARMNCSLTCADLLPPLETPKKYTDYQCTAPPVPADGVPSTPLASNYNLGDAVTFICNVNSQTRTTRCLSDGSWTPIGYVCGGCPEGWYLYNSKCYRPVLEKKTFAAASAVCSSYGAIVAEIRDAASADYLFKLRDDGLTTWTGLKEVSDGVWKWQDGSVPTWTNWDTGAPSLSPGELLCSVSTPSYKWWDTYCDYTNYFTCQLTPAAPTLCVDRRPDCANLVGKDPTLCALQPDFASQMCPATCAKC